MNTSTVATLTAEATRRSPSEVLDAVRSLIPVLRDRIAETERLRRLPDASIEAAHDAGVFSLLLPATLGGSGGGVHDFSAVTRLLAQGDPSAAWTISFLTEHNWMLARYPQEVQDEVFAHGGPALMAAVANPPGRAESTEGGYLVTGRWGYCSGVMHSEWVQITATIDGAEHPSLFLLPRTDVEVLDTWYMAGIKGSGSNDVAVERQFVPSHRSVDIKLWHSRFNHGASLHPEPIYAYDARDLLVFLMPSLVVGTAEAMLELYRDRLDKRRAAFSANLAGDTAMGQVRYARAVAALRGAQALLTASLDLTVEINEQSPDELSDETRALIKLDCLTICRLARESIELVTDGSGSSIYRTADITQHYLRDVQTILSHLTIDEDIMQAAAGQILLGRATEPDPARNFT